jgi:hypothetical protein
MGEAGYLRDRQATDGLPIRASEFRDHSPEFASSAFNGVKDMTISTEQLLHTLAEVENLLTTTASVIYAKSDGADNQQKCLMAHSSDVVAKFKTHIDILDQWQMVAIVPQITQSHRGTQANTLVFYTKIATKPGVSPWKLIE